jgi:hypothetical protein
MKTKYIIIALVLILGITAKIILIPKTQSKIEEVSKFEVGSIIEKEAYDHIRNAEKKLGEQNICPRYKETIYEFELIDRVYHVEANIIYFYETGNMEQQILPFNLKIDKMGNVLSIDADTIECLTSS